jgi:hypothetical protein
MWDIEFRWLQTATSIRHADTVDVKFAAGVNGEPKYEKVIALRHPDLLQLSRDTGHPLTDGWCLKLGALHLKRMIETAEDMDKTLVTVGLDDMRRLSA